MGNEQSEEELKEFEKKHLYGAGIGGYHFKFNDEHSLRLRDELKIDCVPVVVILDKNLDIITMEGAEDLNHLSPEASRSLWV